MKDLYTRAEDRYAAGEGPLRLEALVVYEDLATGLRARQTLDRTVRELAADADVLVNLWRFDLLSEPGLRQRAAKEAADADIVFVSAHGRGALPATVNLWFREWFASKGGEPCALAVSLDANAKDTPSAIQMMEALDAAVRRAGVDLFLHVGEARSELEAGSKNLPRPAETPPLLIDEIVPPAERHARRGWGINE